ncbi:MAG: hypothetical protein P1U56_10760, partial [Saprospiraceae bacterium]|nr:hypothetical protein [Saprospiraceae bacterium]
MTRLLVFFCILITYSGFTQSEWQEHLSHDRISNGHYGHFIIDDDITLLMANAFTPMNTLETIKGNTQKEQEVIQEYFTYRSKTTRTGVDSKEILLFEAWDYDINGYGAHSIYERDNSFFNRSIGELEDN